MLNGVIGLKKIYLAAGCTDLSRGIDGLATLIRFRFQFDSYDKNMERLLLGKIVAVLKNSLLYESNRLEQSI